MNPAFNEARLNLAALSLNNRDYNTAEENFRAVLQAQPKNYEATIGLGRRAARQQEDRRGGDAVQRGAEAGSPEPLQLLQPRPPLPGLQGRPEAGAAEGAGLLPSVPGQGQRSTPDGLQQRGREAHQGHRRNLRRPRRGGQDAGRGRGDAAQGRRAAEADGRADEEAGGRGGRRCRRCQEQGRPPRRWQRATGGGPAAKAPNSAAGPAPIPRAPEGRPEARRRKGKK